MKMCAFFVSCPLLKMLRTLPLRRLYVLLARMACTLICAVWVLLVLRSSISTTMRLEVPTTLIKSFRFPAIILAFCVLLLSLSPPVFASALDAPAYMRSNATFDFLSNSLIESVCYGGNGGWALRPSSGSELKPHNAETLEFHLRFSGRPPVQHVFFSFVCSGPRPDVLVNGNPATVVLTSSSVYSGRAVYSPSIISTPTSRSQELNISFTVSSLSDHTEISLVDVSGLGSTVKTFSAPAAWYNVYPGNITTSNTLSAWPYNFSHQEGLYEVPMPSSKSPVVSTSISVLRPNPGERMDFLSFRFYLPATHVEWVWDDSGANWKFTTVAGSPLVSVSLGGTSSLIPSAITAYPDVQIYESASPTNYFVGCAGSICYDVTVDISSLDNTMLSTYYTLTLELMPYLASYSNGYPSWNYAARVNGGGHGLYEYDSNLLNTYTLWYSDFANDLWGREKSFFGDYLDSIVGALSFDVPSAVTAVDDISTNSELAGSLISSGGSALSGILSSVSLPVAVISALSVLSSVSGFFSSGFGLLVLSCAVLVPLAVGIVMKILNGGD